RHVHELGSCGGSARHHGNRRPKNYCRSSSELLNKLPGELIPLLLKEGWPRHQRMIPFRKGRGRGGQFGEIFRPEHFAELLLRLRPIGLALRATPSAALSVASRLLIDAAATPPSKGGECAH